jgi:hypothetical protein
MKLEFYGHILEKNTQICNIKPSSGAWLCHSDPQTDIRTETDGRWTERQTETDRPDEANSYFRNFAKAPGVRIVENIRSETSNKPVSKTG